MIKILIDCFGGDHSPEANVDGALAAMSHNSDLYLILTGDERSSAARNDPSMPSA